jgi:hypothetical protein
MKTLKTLIAVIAFIGITQTSQAQVMDIGVLAGGVAYQKFVPDAKMDNVLHFWGAYFGTVALSDLLKRWDAPRLVQLFIPIVAGSLAVFAKEYLDNSTSFDDIKAGMMGVGAATIRISFKL